jgi:hypothetical protein
MHSCVVAATASLWLGSSAVADTAADAARAYAESDWPAAAAAYGQLAEANPADGRSLYRLAVSLRHVGRLDEAEQRLSQAQSAGVPAQFIEPERARLHLAAGDSAAAIAALAAAADAGFSNAASIESDPFFAPIAGEPGFAAAMDKVRRNGAPCEYDPRFSEFDFWVGHWAVRDGAGNPQGENRIEKTERGCVLVERWNGATGGTGISMNYFDPAAGQWVQVWVSPTLQIDIRGGLEDGAMRLTGTVYYLQNDERFPFRGTWTPQEGGVVRQHFEQSADDGETWSTWFDGYYHRIQE